MSKKNSVQSFIGIFFLGWILFFQGFLCALEPFSVYLTWQHNPATSMSIQWISEINDQENTLLYQKKGEEEVWHRKLASKKAMPSNQPYWIHSVEIQGLDPHSLYHFRIGKEEKIYSFRTLPEHLKSPIRFVVGGDMYQGDLSIMEKTNRAAAAKSPLFVIIGGDIAYSATNDPAKPEDAHKWLNWLKVWKETMVTPEGDLIPILPAIGNHEVRGGFDRSPQDAEFFYALFPTPGPQGYQVLDFGDYMSLWILDSGHTHAIKGLQTKWLQQTLKDRAKRTHKFAVYHIPAYPSFRRYYSSKSRLIRHNWVPLFEQYKLDVAFENNDHAYKRSNPILKGKVNPEGVLYIGDGAWSVASPRKPKSSKDSWYIARSVSTLYFLLVTLEGSKQCFQAYTPEGHLIDEIKN